VVSKVKHFSFGYFDSSHEGGGYFFILSLKEQRIFIKELKTAS